MMKYPSDQELENWILELEQEELYAPRHLKEEILKKATQPAELRQMAGTAEDVKKMQLAECSGRSPEHPQSSFFAYTLKIVAGMAAAILLTFVLPANNGMDISRAKERMERMEVMADKRQEQLIEAYTLPDEEENGSRRRSNFLSHIEAEAAQLFEKADEVKELNIFWNKNQGGN
ncbi:MAG: hypothetical protein IKY23_07435 [Lachnospiraceae bacterium]|nr:hypothetical protein [Lachnospiraceae bacterium]